MRRRIAMDQLPRHVKGTFYCEECDTVYPIRYMDRHYRTYKHQHNLLSLEKRTPNSPICNRRLKSMTY